MSYNKRRYLKARLQGYSLEQLEEYHENQQLSEKLREARAIGLKNYRDSAAFGELLAGVLLSKYGSNKEKE